MALIDMGMGADYLFPSPYGEEVLKASEVIDKNDEIVDAVSVPLRGRGFERVLRLLNEGRIQSLFPSPYGEEVLKDETLC